MKDPLASRPFALEDLDRIRDAADRHVVTWHLDGHRADPVWMGQFVRFSLHFGPHISVLSGGWRHRTDRETRQVKWRFSEPISSRDLRQEGSELYLVWRRPKNEEPIPAPVPDSMKPWLPHFLDAYRPTRRPRYNELLRSLEDELAGHRLLLTPSRFRHTAAVNLLEAGMLPQAVCALLGTTSRTLDKYANLTTQQIAQRMRDRGLLA